MNGDFISKGRSVSDLKAHLVLTTKSRRSVFTKPMLDRMHEIFEDLLGKWECKLIEFNGEENHVHLLFQYLPQMELAKFINNLKTVSSRRMRSEFEAQIDKVYHKEVLWNGSYFIASCGGVTVSTLRKSIENQDSPE
jgi:putative transposase